MITASPPGMYADLMAKREVMGVQEARDTFRKRVDEAIEQGTLTVVTRHGRSVAAIVPMEFLRRALEALGEPTDL